MRKILEIKEGEQCVVIGTLFKDLKLRPNLIEAYAKDRQGTSAVHTHRFLPGATEAASPARRCGPDGSRMDPITPRRRLQEALEEVRRFPPLPHAGASRRH